MSTDHRTALAKVKRFDQLIAYLRDEMGWPIARDSFEDVDDLFYNFTADELGIDPKTAAKIESIKRLRPLSPRQPWGIFFVKFEPKRLPVVALRRILSQVALKKRASANSAERAAWASDDLLFVSNYGEGEERQISFAHFSKAPGGHDLPTLKVLGWDNLDTALHLDAVAKELTQHLAWPEDEKDTDAWRERWRAAFTLGHREVVTTSKELSIRLAELARAIRDRTKTALAIETDRGPLTKLMKAFQKTLVHDLDVDGFADMYAQTIAYGLLSARIADPHKRTADDFAGHMRTNPFLRELMETFLKMGGRRGKAGGPGIDFDELGVSEVVELLDDANMEAVVRDFGDRNPQEDPVIHFYELFLSAYNKQLKIQRGVFYTPQPVVSYIVRSVHELLQTEFSLADGLADTTTWGEMVKKHAGLRLPPLTDEPGEQRTISADEPFVQILDPATGTATFLVEVIDVVHRTLMAKWKQQRLTEGQQRAAWNDYVPKHLLPRLHAFELMMAPYAIAHMKVGLKLAETGYRFGTEERARIYLTNALEPWVKQLPLVGFDALAHEAAAVNEIKRHKRFTVVIGNPPYSGNSANTGEWISSLVQDYYQVDGAGLGERNSKWLQDDYVKFVRAGQFFCHQSSLAVLGLITNHGYIDNPTFRGMRQSLLIQFRGLWILDLHGNTKKKETTVDGGLDENVFDIQQGVAIVVAASGTKNAFGLKQADVFGTRAQKYALLSSSSAKGITWREVKPVSPFYVFLPQSVEVGAEYLRYPSIKQAMPVNVLGFQTHRDDFAVAFDRETILSRCEALRDTRLKDSEIKTQFEVKDNRDWNVHDARKAIRGDSKWKDHIIRCLYRPFDSRWCYFSTVAMDYPRRELLDHVAGKENLCLLVPRQISFLPWQHTGVSDTVAESCLVSTKTKEQNYNFPLYLYPQSDRLALASGRRVNFSEQFLRDCAAALKSPQLEPHGCPAGLTPEDIFRYACAVFHSPGYRSRYADFLKMDFPRLPLTENLELFRALVRLGGELVALHLLESSKLDQPITEFLGARRPEVEKVSWSKNTVWVDKVQTAGFKGVREDVWNFHIGGYQVCEKWLKDRKGRTLAKDDVAHYQKIVVAVAETIRLMKEIDEVIEAHGGWPGAFSGAKDDG